MIEINFYQPEGLTTKGLKKWTDVVGSSYLMLNNYYKKEIPRLQRDDFKNWQYHDQFIRDRESWDKLNVILRNVPRHDLEEVFNSDNSVSVILSNLIQEVICLREELQRQEGEIDRLNSKVGYDDY